MRILVYYEMPKYMQKSTLLKDPDGPFGDESMEIIDFVEQKEKYLR